MPTVQLNTRIDATLKEEGDRVFAALGYTSSEVVRILWRFAQQHTENPEEVRRALSALDSRESADESVLQEKLSRIEQGPSLMKGFFASYGFTPDPELASFDCSEALGDALFERYGQEAAHA